MFDNLGGAEQESVSAENVSMENAPAETVMPEQERMADEVRALRAELHDIKAGYALDALLERSGAKNPAFLKKIFDVGSIVIGDGGVPDMAPVEEMLAMLRKTDGYLFEDMPAAHAPAPAETPLYRAPTVRDTDGMSDAEYYSYKMMTK